MKGSKGLLVIVVGVVLSLALTDSHYSARSQGSATFPDVGRLLLSEDFDSYPAGTSASELGWQVKGAAFSVDGFRSYSAPHALRMETGSYAFNEALAPLEQGHQVVVYEARVSVLGNNVRLGLWGEGEQTPLYGGIIFHGASRRVFALGPTGALLQEVCPIELDRWYLVQVRVDLAARTSDIWIDHELKASSVVFGGTGNYTHLCLYGESWTHGYVDDLRVHAPFASGVQPREVENGREQRLLRSWDLLESAERRARLSDVVSAIVVDSGPRGGTNTRVTEATIHFRGLLQDPQTARVHIKTAIAENAEVPELQRLRAHADAGGACSPSEWLPAPYGRQNSSGRLPFPAGVALAADAGLGVPSAG